MRGTLSHYKRGEWVQRHCSLADGVLSISKTDSADEVPKKIEINEKTHVTLIDRTDEPCFVIENESVGCYKLKAPPSEVYSWVFTLRSQISLTSPDAMEKPRVISQISNSAYGVSTLCESKNVLYVVNQISKQKLMEYRSVARHVSERNLIFSLPSNPFLLNLCYTTQDESFFYLWLEYPAGGELLSFLASLPVIPDKDLRFYAAEIIVALDFLHSNFIVFRDLCPSNVLLSNDGHIKLGAYGTMQRLGGEHYESEYLAPEVIKGGQYDHKADWWSLGIILYDILFEQTPFIGASNQETKDNIFNMSVVFKRFKNSPVADLIQQLLTKDPQQRPDLDDIEKHPFFSSINWSLVRSRLAKPDSFTESTLVDFSKTNPDFHFDSEFLPASSAYTGLDTFSFGNEYSSDI